MGVLDVVDPEIDALDLVVLVPVAVAPLLDELADVAHPFRLEIDRRGGVARREEPPRGVDADLGQEVVEGHEFTGPLGHRDDDHPSSADLDDMLTLAVVRGPLAQEPDP